MANPFLVLGGIAVGLVTATFGVLQVPGWVASAQDASAKNDVAQVSILQSASLSQTGVVTPDLADKTAIDALGVKVSTQGAVKLALGADTDAAKTGVQAKEYAVTVKSDSGKSFLRINGGDIIEIESGVTVPTEYAELVTLAAGATDGVVKALGA